MRELLKHAVIDYTKQGKVDTNSEAFGATMALLLYLRETGAFEEAAKGYLEAIKDEQ
jgi:hypothetical protein